MTSLSEAVAACAKFRDGDEDRETIGASEYYDHQTGRVFTDARTEIARIHYNGRIEIL